MEYLDGINLESLVRQYGPQEPGRVLRILRQVCGALVEAHEIGMIHRDIKPANIILTERGGEPDVAKLLDFGLVKLRPETAVDTEAATVTIEAGNVVMGTPAYMSPEAIATPDTIDGRVRTVRSWRGRILSADGTTGVRGDERRRNDGATISTRSRFRHRSA